jgi:8-oxo-dGTP pyrophosphatase MutT (NUDIX family)
MMGRMISLLILLRQNKNSWDVYMPQRINPFLLELPGGKIEEGESPYQALCREVEEEIGIQLSKSAMVHSAIFVGPSVDGKKSLVFYPFVVRYVESVHGALNENLWRNLDHIDVWGNQTFPITRDMLNWLRPQIERDENLAFFPVQMKESIGWVYL